MDKQKKRVQRLVENIQKNHAGVCQAKKLLLFVFLATLTKKKFVKPTQLQTLCDFLNFLFTDLSVAGLPAELKHITQRRKRKQP